MYNTMFQQFLCVQIGHNNMWNINYILIEISSDEIKLYIQGEYLIDQLLFNLAAGMNLMIKWFVRKNLLATVLWFYQLVNIPIKTNYKDNTY